MISTNVLDQKKILYVVNDAAFFLSHRSVIAKAAKDAGMVVIVRIASYNRELDFSSADYTVEDLREIPPLLKRLNG